MKELVHNDRGWGVSVSPTETHIHVTSGKFFASARKERTTELYRLGIWRANDGKRIYDEQSITLAQLKTALRWADELLDDNLE